MRKSTDICNPHKYQTSEILVGKIPAQQNTVDLFGLWFYPLGYLPLSIV